MKDVTPLLDSYQECIRHLWNVNYRALKNADCIFADIESRIFNTLVLSELECPYEEGLTMRSPIKALRIEPDFLTPQDDCFNALTAKEDIRRFHWKDRRLNRQAIEISFIGFFDWDSEGIRHLQYYRGRIEKYSIDKALEGEDVLIETFRAKVFFTEIRQP